MLSKVFRTCGIDDVTPSEVKCTTGLVVLVFKYMYLTVVKSTFNPVWLGK